MSMLADPRYKQKISVDPRNLQWKNDKNKVGLKMMEKMGWAEGKGLGAKGDGNIDPIKVSLKNNNRGVGCTQNYADNWIAHQDDFNSLLANLNAQNAEEKPASDPEPNQVLSLEQRSKKSKGRVHYMKFTKGKDLSRKSAADLDCVFGRRKSTPTASNNVSEANSEEENEGSKDEYVEKSDVKTFNSGTSVQEYFAKKMAALKMEKNVPVQPTGGDDSSDSGEMRLGFGMSSNPINNRTDDAEEKKTFYGFLPSSENFSSTSSVTPTIIPCEISNQDATEDGSAFKKKKKKKRKNEKEDSDSADTENQTKEEEVDTKVKKTKKKKSKKHDDRNVETQNEVEEPSTEGVSKKKKKKKSKSKDRETELPSSSDEAAAQEDNVSKKEKKRKITIEEQVDGEVQDAKKAKMNTDEKTDTDAPLESEISDEPKKNKRKRNKSKKNKDKPIPKIPGLDLGFNGGNIQSIKGYGHEYGIDNTISIRNDDVKRMKLKGEKKTQ